jgi:hypothetical protein
MIFAGTTRPRMPHGVRQRLRAMGSVAAASPVEAVLVRWERRAPDRLPSMAIDRSGKWWKGSGPADLDEYLAVSTEDTYPVVTTVHASCQDCGSGAFRVRFDAKESCAERTCAACGRRAFMLGSREHVEGAALEPAACPCGGDSFNVAAGFAVREDPSDVKWVYLGLRCIRDGVLGCCADWKIDYSPSAHLLDTI